MRTVERSVPLFQNEKSIAQLWQIYREGVFNDVRSVHTMCGTTPGSALGQG